MSLDALETLSGPSSWAVFNTGLVLVVGVSRWAVVGNLPLLLPLEVVAVPDILELLSVEVNSGTLNLPTVLDSFLGEALPLWVVLDDVLDGPLVPVVVSLNPVLVPHKIRSLVLVSPRSSRNNPLSQVSVVLNSAHGVPLGLESESLVELDVSNLSSSGPSLMGENPLDESSVLGVLVLNDELGSDDLLVLPSLHVPGSDGPVTVVVESSSDFENSPSVGHFVSSLDDSISLLVFNVAPALSDSNVLLLVVLEDLLGNDLHGSLLSADLLLEPFDAVGSPMIASDSHQNDLILATVFVAESPSLIDNPSDLSSFVGHLLADASPLLTRVDLDRVSSLLVVDLDSVTLLGLNSGLLGNLFDSSLLPLLSILLSFDFLSLSSDVSSSDKSSVDLELSDVDTSDDMLSLVLDNESDLSVLSDFSSDLINISSLENSDLSSSDYEILSVEFTSEGSSLLSVGSDDSSFDHSDVSSDDLSSVASNKSSETLLLSRGLDDSSVGSSEVLLPLSALPGTLALASLGPATGARPGSNMTTVDLLVGVGRFPGSLGSPALTRFLPFSSPSDLEASVELLDLSVPTGGDFGEPSSSILIQTLSGEDKFSHSSVAHHGVNHALEFLCEIFFLSQSIDIQIDL